MSGKKPNSENIFFHVLLGVDQNGQDIELIHEHDRRMTRDQCQAAFLAELPHGTMMSNFCIILPAKNGRELINKVFADKLLYRLICSCSSSGFNCGFEAGQICSEQDQDVGNECDCAGEDGEPEAGEDGGSTTIQ